MNWLTDSDCKFSVELRQYSQMSLGETEQSKKKKISLKLLKVKKVVSLRQKKNSVNFFSNLCPFCFLEKKLIKSSSLPVLPSIILNSLSQTHGFLTSPFWNKNRQFGVVTVVVTLRESNELTHWLIFWVLSQAETIFTSVFRQN